MPTETRPMHRRDAKHPRYCPFGAFVLVLILHLADLPRPADDEEPAHGQA
ncbi:hypothetical protein [Paraliomyxa miuraensis]|nr:hypothetical protein [Paraliomyxa miuraensis]MCX4244200.1 hypothetical protein [Paraliomyxa miuraensis]